jgi:hypothetical protein
MKTIQKSISAFLLIFLASCSLLAQNNRGNNNGGGGGGGTNNLPQTPAPAPIDITISSFTLKSTTVTREQMVSGTVKLNLKSGTLKAGDKVMLLFIPDEADYTKDPRNAYQYGPVAFNADGEAVVEIADPNGYAVEGTYKSVVKVNPESLVAESDYTNNAKSVNVTVKPHVVDLDFRIQTITAWDNMESTGKWEYRMKYRIGKRDTPEGTTTWITDYKWWPKAPDASNQSVDYRQMDADPKDGVITEINQTTRLNDVSENAYLVFEVLAYDDEKNKEDVFDNKEDEYAGKVVGQYPQLKTWKAPLDTTTGSAGSGKSDKGTYSIKTDTRVVKVD